ncbi:hypothetical protein EOL94_03430 [bacterium]|nr:hypothetical protein [bacterium]
MKKVGEHVVFSVSLEDVNLAVVEILKKKGYTPVRSLNNNDIQSLISLGEFLIDTKKGIIPEKEKLYFSEYFLNRLSGVRFILNMFFNNVDKKQINEIVGQAFYSISEKEQKVLISSFSLDKENGVKKVKSTEEVYSLSGVSSRDEVLVLVANIISDLSAKVESIFVNELEKGNLSGILINESEKEDLKSSKIIELGFSAKTTNCLYNLTLKEVLEVENDELLKIRNFGKESLREVQFFKTLYEL